MLRAVIVFEGFFGWYSQPHVQSIRCHCKEIDRMTTPETLRKIGPDGSFWTRLPIVMGKKHMVAVSYHRHHQRKPPALERVQISLRFARHGFTGLCFAPPPPPPKVLLLCRSWGACVPCRFQRLCQLELWLLVGLTTLDRLWERGQTKCNTPLMLATSVFGQI